MRKNTCPEKVINRAVPNFSESRETETYFILALKIAENSVFTTLDSSNFVKMQEIDLLFQAKIPTLISSYGKF